MDAHSIKQRIVAIFLVGAGFCLPASADLAPITYRYSQDFNLPIPSLNDPCRAYGMGWMDDATITVPDSFIIWDINVAVSLTHEAFFDLNIIIQSPAGTRVVLNPAGNLSFIVKDKGGLRPVGGSAQWFFDDEADVSIEQATEPYSGPYQPVEHLSAFDGESTFGQWHLRIEDACYDHTGELKGFELIFTIPEPSTAILLMLGAGLVILTGSRVENKRRMTEDGQPLGYGSSGRSLPEHGRLGAANSPNSSFALAS